MAGEVYLIPTYLSESNKADFIAEDVKKVIRSLDYFFVENVRTARRFISSLDLSVDIASLTFEIVDKNFEDKELPRIFKPVIDQGKNVGVLSEAGLPGIADPGRKAVKYAQANGIKVVTLPGASAMLLALIASGFSGQQFTFHGYLPIDERDRVKKLHDLEKEAQQTGYTQLFMETPYRNMKLWKSMMRNLNKDTLLFVGADLTGEKEICKTRKVSDWTKITIDLHKIPTVFGIGQ
jgi:16S rRNA (cytidine1402-2'-O)-methyltransferase